MKKLLFWGFLLATIVLSLIPPAYLVAPVFSIWDKAQHALGFAVLMGLGLVAYPALARWRLGLLLLALGGGIEIAQHATGWRYAEWSDWLADAIGISLAWLVVASAVYRISRAA